MGTTVDVQVIGLDRLQARLDPARLRAAMVPALEKAGGIVEAAAKANTPRDTAALQRSITHQVDAEGLSVKVGTNLSYAPYVHGFMDGTATRSKPHFPPVAALAGWAARHGIPAGAVARAIAKRGTPLVPFLRQAKEETAEQVRGILNAAARTFSGGA